MKLTKNSPLSGAANTIDLPFDEQTFEALMNRWKNGELIQDVFGMLNANEREFIMTGLLPAEWDKIHLTDDDDEMEEELDAEDY